jgi:hypothetical protein|tara:strand:- start:12876 stop:13277 length:402 start_codon:yes stop_codon:yes gene_type:complete
MALNIKPLSDNDYDNILCAWWKDWRWTAPAKDFLPERGYMVYYNDEPICAGYMYITNSNVVLLEWIVSSFKFKDKKIRKEALYMLIETITSLARGLDKKYVYSLLKNKPLIQLYSELGFVKGGDNGCEMIKKL